LRNASPAPTILESKGTLLQSSVPPRESEGAGFPSSKT
jgi:hypothetical protein